MRKSFEVAVSTIAMINAINQYAKNVKFQAKNQKPNSQNWYAFSEIKYCKEWTKAKTHIKIHISFLKIINLFAKEKSNTRANMGKNNINQSKSKAFSQLSCIAWLVVSVKNKKDKIVSK